MIARVGSDCPRRRDGWSPKSLQIAVPSHSSAVAHVRWIGLTAFHPTGLGPSQNWLMPHNSDGRDCSSLAYGGHRNRDVRRRRTSPRRAAVEATGRHHGAESCPQGQRRAMAADRLAHPIRKGRQLIEIRAMRPIHGSAI